MFSDVVVNFLRSRWNSYFDAAGVLFRIISEADALSEINKFAKEHSSVAQINEMDLEVM